MGIWVMGIYNDRCIRATNLKLVDPIPNLIIKMPKLAVFWEDIWMQEVRMVCGIGVGGGRDWC